MIFMLFLEVISVFLVGVAMSMALAHALEYPGKLRLDEQTYLAVQTIYYPGFTIGGVGEILAVIATLVLTIAMRNNSAAFWWALVAFIAVLAMHLVFWLITQPVNRYWLKYQQLTKTGALFFGVHQDEQSADRLPSWTYLRKRWEYSHIVRAAFSAIALITLVIAVAI
jgi:hypothetical protein